MFDFRRWIFDQTRNNMEKQIAAHMKFEPACLCRICSLIKNNPEQMME